MERILVAMRNGLEILERDDGEWTQRRRAPVAGIERVAVHPAQPDRVFLGSVEAGLLRSTDGAASFSPIGVSEIEEAVTSLAIDPTDPATVFAGTEPSRLYRSTDSGDSWAEIENMTAVRSASEWSFPPRPDTHHVRWIEIAPEDSDRWYVGIEAGALLVTTDAGASWIDRPTGSRRDNHTLATHPSDPKRVYSAAGDGYAESHDGGESWSHPQAGLEHRYVWGLAVDPGDPGVRLVSAAHGASRAHRSGTAESHVYRRIDDEPWTALTDTGLPTGAGVLRPVLAGGNERGEFVAASNRGVFRTEDRGDHWMRIDDEWRDRYGETTVRDVATV